MCQPVITKRRICWPEPDSVCLEGGCLYCNYNRFRSINVIRKYAEKARLMRHFNYGLRNDFFNVDTK